jgi:hypothetical protein
VEFLIFCYVHQILIRFSERSRIDNLESLVHRLSNDLHEFFEVMSLRLTVLEGAIAQANQTLLSAAPNSARVRPGNANQSSHTILDNPFVKFDTVRLRLALNFSCESILKSPSLSPPIGLRSWSEQNYLRWKRTWRFFLSEYR